MKICYVHEEYPEETNFGGIATYQKRLAVNMAMIGHTVYVIARSLEKDSSTVENGVHIIRIFRPLNANTLDDYIDYRKKVCFTIEDLEKEESIDRLLIQYTTCMDIPLSTLSYFLRVLFFI